MGHLERTSIPGLSISLGAYFKEVDVAGLEAGCFVRRFTTSLTISTFEGLCVGVSGGIAMGLTITGADIGFFVDYSQADWRGFCNCSTSETLKFDELNQSHCWLPHELLQRLSTTCFSMGSTE